ncbi:hypothetical protein F0919_15600 [Taibaiella lutea]|uniref:Uncharacterized protein n=1 Tax=Taibaiella lutea TaxID=2608001 RepID=A0A5M6CEC6_9BACT|nr:hypothetical protein [Taibaiella lutea]KAA5532222.1 hypothetical protein F0919_15600 [Taibaiella lutea]
MLLLIIVFSGNEGSAYGQNPPDSFFSLLHCDAVYIESGNLFEDVYFMSAGATKVSISLKLYELKATNDSILLYSVSGTDFEAGRGANRLTVPFKDRRVKANIREDWLGAFKSIERMPAGNYACIIQVKNTDAGKDYTERILLSSDTLITEYTRLDGGIGRILGNGSIKVSKVLDSKSAVLERYYQKKGIACSRRSEAGKELLDLYYGSWYLGRKELPSDMTTGQYAQSSDALRNNLDATGKDALSDYHSLLSRFRDMQNTSKENTELVADISLSGNFANGQEPNSGLSNNYYEGRADVELPLFDIPVQVSGFYTTQDMHRQAKASYIHFRYDAEKAREQMLKLISGFNNKYSQALTKGSGYDLIYGQFVAKLQQEKDRSLANFTKQYGIDENGLSGLSEERLQQIVTERAEQQGQKLTDSLKNKADTSAIANNLNDKKDKALAAKQQAEEKYEKAKEQYQKLLELQQKIDKYKALLEQYKKSNFYDSAMAYGKIKDLKNYENMSCKDMAKKAASLLPESKTKGMVTGLVNFDAGMFPKYVSDYTMSGQMMKGLDMSYDIGFATVGGSYGKMEYIDRNGNVEGYKAYSGRIEFKPVVKQTFGFVYYGYSPGKSLLGGGSGGDGFFKDVDVSMPSFRNPVSILSATYKGEIGDNVTLSGEYAFSDKPGQSDEAKEQVMFMDKSAYNFKAAAMIPQTDIEIESGYEHAGKAFENNTLPVLLAGTDRLFIKTKGDFFRNFLTLGAEYNYLIQKSFYSKGSNSKWGFDIATHSRRYPSVALSYKPFSTFRSFNDTLNIAQKPISGEVWTGKANYQIKRQDRAIRFTLIYSRNSSTDDTIQYKSSTAQLSTMLSKKTTMLMVNIGHSNIDAGSYETAYPIYNNSWFANASLGGMVGESIQLTGGIDITKAGPGISKYGCFVSSGYAFKKLPLTIRGNFRYSNFRMAETTSRQQLVSGGIELSWRIKEKLYTD